MWFSKRYSETISWVTTDSSFRDLSSLLVHGGSSALTPIRWKDFRPVLAFRKTCVRAPVFWIMHHLNNSIHRLARGLNPLGTYTEKFRTERHRVNFLSFHGVENLDIHF